MVGMLSHPNPRLLFLPANDARKPLLKTCQTYSQTALKISAEPSNAYPLTGTSDQKNSFVWNRKIRTSIDNNLHEEALIFYSQMVSERVLPDNFTFPLVLKACSSLTALPEGKQVHSHVIKNGFFENNVFVQNSLLFMYAKCGYLDIARQLFDKMHQRSLVSWNSMIAAYSKFESCRFDNYIDRNSAILMYVLMLQQGISPDKFTFTVLLRACAFISAVQEGFQIHAHVIKLGFEFDGFIRNTLIDMYAKFGLMESVFELFDRMPEKDLVSWNAVVTGFARLGDCDSVEALFRIMPLKDVVSWNSMIASYVRNGCADEALALFRQMQLEGICPNAVTIVNALSACSLLGALSLGIWIHSYSDKNGFSSNEFVNATLIDMYAKCGDIENACRVFEKLSKKDVVLWDVMLEGFAFHGLGREALELFDQMRREGVKPDEITFIGVLSACNHSGLMEEGFKYFESMAEDFGIMPKVEHFACMVDLLGRAGRLYEALKLIESMNIAPDGAVWGALLSACRIHNNIELAETVAKRILEFDSENVANYVLLSNIYAIGRQWKDVANVRKMMKSKGLEKEPGCSSIEMGGQVHEFLAGDCSHPQSETISQVLDDLTKRLKMVGYVPNIVSVLQDMGEEEKESALYRHSEKLALAFGLINSTPGTPIRIVKNLSICGDCHSAMKLTSMIESREIVVRDRSRFHRFTHGSCSCGDYW